LHLLANRRNRSDPNDPAKLSRDRLITGGLDGIYRSIKMADRQQDFVFREWGGKRKGAGRKRTLPGRPRVPHRSRVAHRKAYPVHVTLRAREGLPPLRDEGIFAEVREALAKASRSPTVGDAFRVIEFSIQNDHAHFIVEAHDKDALSRGLRGMVIRLARAVNRALHARGPVWADRYHARELTTPRAVRNALVYVLMNAKKHRLHVARVDRFSSAPWFDGFAQRIEAPTEPCPVFAPKTWLGAIGWRRRGLVRFDECPRAPG
jgi:putative transposase